MAKSNFLAYPSRGINRLPFTDELKENVKSMNRQYFYMAILVVAIGAMSCHNKSRVYSLLNSNEKDDVIMGAYLAGESKNEEFVPLLLKNAWDERRSTNIRFKGFSVYQERMIALRKIFNKYPPKDITYRPDSSIITFYTVLTKSKNWNSPTKK